MVTIMNIEPAPSEFIGAALLPLAALIAWVRAWPAIAGLISSDEKWTSGDALRARYRGAWWLSVAACLTAEFIPTFLLLFPVSRLQHSTLTILMLMILAFGVFLAVKGPPLTIRWYCHHCGKRQSNHEEWVCGFCNEENRDYFSHSFLNRCKHCKAKPAAVLCTHCGEPTVLISSGDQRHPARSTVQPLPGESEEEAHRRRDREIAERRYEIDRLKQEREIKELEMKLERMTNPPKRDALADRERWLQEQVNLMRFEFDAMAKSIDQKRQAIEQVRNNAAYSPKERRELIDYISGQWDELKESIRARNDLKS